MKKVILTCCVLSALSLTLVSCSKKSDTTDNTTTTTSTTATTATTATTSTTGTPPRPTPDKNQLVIDTNIVGYTSTSCSAIGGGRWSMSAHKTTNMANVFTATFSKQPGFTQDFTIIPTLPSSSSQVQITAYLDSLLYVGSAGTLHYTTTANSTSITFTDVTFTNAGHPSVLISGNVYCP